MIIDDFMPIYSFKEYHNIVIETEPNRVLTSSKELTLQEVLTFRILMGIRSLPGRLIGKNSFKLVPQQTLLTKMLDAGFVHLSETPNKEIVLDLIGQFWKICIDHPIKVADAQEFFKFNDPDYAKAVINFYIEDNEVSKNVKLSTETRIYIPDPVTKRKFVLYWMLIHPGSSVIRGFWLKAIKRRAENC